MRRILGFLVLLTPFIFAGCPDSIGTVTSKIDTWDFAMGNRGGGTISYIAIGPEHGEKSALCLDPICRLTVDDLTLIRLTPITKDGYTFKRWDSDPANGLPCEVSKEESFGIIQVKVSRNGACFAVFEGSVSTPPGIRHP